MTYDAKSRLKILNTLQLNTERTPGLEPVNCDGCEDGTEHDDDGEQGSNAGQAVDVGPHLPTITFRKGSSKTFPLPRIKN